MTLFSDLIADRAWGELVLWVALFVLLWLAGPVVSGQLS